MELNFNELDESLDTKNYWDVSKTTEPKQKAKFGYDDILSSINLVVKDGVLQYMAPVTNEMSDNNYASNYTNNNTNNTTTKKVKKVSIDPNVKNSAIYNKYFKNYRDQNDVPEIKIPKTREEYKQMLLEDYKKKVELQRRLAQIKPKKMFFFGPQQNTSTSIQASQPHTTFNQFFKLNNK